MSSFTQKNVHKDGHQDGHEHLHHGHHHATGEKNLLFSIVLNAVITTAEIAGGILSGSLALLSDAFHNFSDTVSLIISYIAMLVGKRSKNSVKSYGYKRAEILAAFINVITLIMICGYIIYEAVMRLGRPEPIKGALMMAVAAIGLLGNGISVVLLFKDSKSNINIRSAFLHLLGDTVSSVAVIITAAVMLIKPWYMLDAIVSVLIAFYIIKESFSILLESINVLMQGKPAGLNEEMIRKRLCAEKKLRIKSVHHIHIWEITAGKAVFDAHVVVSMVDLSKADDIIHEINIILSNDFNICHSTIQLESDRFKHDIVCGI